MNCKQHQLDSCIRQNGLEQEILAEEILSVVPCEKIFLLAATVTSKELANLFTMAAAPRRRVSHYHVLAVVPRAEKLRNMDAQDKIEGRLQHFIPATAIVLDTEQFADWLKQKHPFALQVNNEACLLHGQRHRVAHNSNGTDTKEQQRKLESLLDQGRNKSLEFLAGADLFRIREQNKLAAFMLHQSLEQMLRTMLLIFTGLEITTHSLDKLVRFCSMFCNSFLELFTSLDGKTQKMMQLLQKAYIDARYRNDYQVSTSELLFLEEKIRTVLNIYDAITKEFFTSFTQQYAKTVSLHPEQTKDLSGIETLIVNQNAVPGHS